MLSQDTLKEWVRYDPETGVFTRLKTKERPNTPRTGLQNRWKHQIGQPTGRVNKNDGYVEVSVNGRRYRGHQLAWLYMTGRWPEKVIDHENRIRSDNRWCNLRAANQTQNMANSVYEKGVSGVRGVHKAGNQWAALIRGRDAEGKRTRTYVRFKTLEEAEAYREQKERERCGEFYRP